MPIKPLFVKEYSSARDKDSLKFNNQKTLETSMFSRVFLFLLFG